MSGSNPRHKGVETIRSTALDNWSSMLSFKLRSPTPPPDPATVAPALPAPLSPRCAPDVGERHLCKDSSRQQQRSEDAGLHQQALSSRQQRRSDKPPHVGSSR